MNDFLILNIRNKQVQIEEYEKVDQPLNHTWRPQNQTDDEKIQPAPFR